MEIQEIPLGFIYVCFFLPTFGGFFHFFSMVNVVKFVPYMDGLGLICWKECQTKCI